MPGPTVDSGSILSGVLGRYSGLPESEIPPPPEWVAVLLYPTFRARLVAFLASQGIDNYTVTSGYRDPSNNERVGGASNSAHMHGLASDVVISAAELLSAGTSRGALVSEWERLTGGFAYTDSGHLHFNLPRSWGWSVIRWFFLLLVLVLVMVFVILRR